MPPSGFNSPTTIDAALEYLTVENYNWPQASRAQRARLDAQERKRRHNACQKRFLARKRREFVQLRRDVARLELQFMWVEAKREIEELESEQFQLQAQLNTVGGDVPARSRETEPMTIGNEARSFDWSFVDVVLSLNVDALVTELGLP